MTRQRYPETFKIEAVKQITERGRPVADVARAIGVSSHSLYAWLKQYGKPADQQIEESALQAEIRRLKTELRQVTVTYIRTQEGWLYLAVVLDLFSRQIVGWAMKPRMTADLAVDALLMAVWRRKPKQPVLVHSDQGSQFTGGEWQDFLKPHNLSCSMSRRGNCHDNAVAESFFQLLKRERIKRRIYATRDEARSDVFDYIEMFYNPIRRHGSNDGLSPVEFERQFNVQQQSV